MLKYHVTGKIGLFDKNGDWTFNPEFDNIFNNEGFRQVEKAGCVGLYTAEL